MKALKCCKIDVLQAVSQPKYWLCFGFLALQMWQLTHGFPSYARALGYPHITPWVLPLLPAYNNQYTIIMLAFLLLCGDAPFRTAQQQFVIQRTGKRSWLIGQVLYLLGLSILFTAVLFLFSFLYYLPMTEWTPEWGKVLTTASVRDLFDAASPFPVDPNILRNTDGLSATLWTAGMQIQVCFFLGLLILACNLWLHRGVGIFFAAALIMLSFFIRCWASFFGHSVFLLWISPVSWVDRSLMGHVNQNLPSFAYGALMLPVLCLAVLAVTVGTIHKCDIAVKGER